MRTALDQQDAEIGIRIVSVGSGNAEQGPGIVRAVGQEDVGAFLKNGLVIRRVDCRDVRNEVLAEESFAEIAMVRRIDPR